MDENEHPDKKYSTTYDPEYGWEPSELDKLDQPPVEVFAAIDGDRKQLAEYLRSGTALSLYTLEAIAAWMAGELPPIRPRGNRHGTRMGRLSKIAGLALAEFEYKRRYKLRGSKRGTALAISDEVAEEFGIDRIKFANFLHRSRSQRAKVPDKLPFLEEMYLDWKTNTKS